MNSRTAIKEHIERDPLYDPLTVEGRGAIQLRLNSMYDESDLSLALIVSETARLSSKYAHLIPEPAWTSPRQEQDMVHGEEA